MGLARCPCVLRFVKICSAQHSPINEANSEHLISKINSTPHSTACVLALFVWRSRSQCGRSNLGIWLAYCRPRSSEIVEWPRNLSKYHRGHKLPCHWLVRRSFSCSLVRLACAATATKNTYLTPNSWLRMTLSRSNLTPSEAFPLPAHTPAPPVFQSIPALWAHLRATSGLPMLSRPW
jgi:hypothetical protein